MKNTPAALLWRTLAGHFLYDAAAALHFARLGLLRPYLRAKVAALAHLPAVLRKRREIQRSRRVPVSAIEPLLQARWMATKLREKRFDSRLAERTP